MHGRRRRKKRMIPKLPIMLRTSIEHSKTHTYLGGEAGEFVVVVVVMVMVMVMVMVVVAV